MATLPFQSQDGTALPSKGTSSPQGPSEEFAWTCGNDSHLRHLKKLNIGGYSEVHQVSHQIPLKPPLMTCLDRTQGHRHRRHGIRNPEY